MKNFLKHMIIPMAIISSIPSLGLFFYWITQRKDLLATSIFIYFGLAIGNIVNYFYKHKSDSNNS
ncbi:hypothetical protein [Clostridium tarantellae]|uniref:Uncharacterized protein n=1 Tax=Clostridium tarantellae TaxID=39493 RepID=A0A6I1MQW4_9CLOT|nr:hypothetical protein [Clostridium tarantellae]MPQ44848.1 hypothetical protein [Clostridium tarantellae]